MNSRLVDSIAQIVLAMSVEERQRFDQLIANSQPQLPNEGGQDGSSYKEGFALSKDTKIVEIARQMQEFEDKHAMPLSPLPSEQWDL